MSSRGERAASARHPVRSWATPASGSRQWALRHLFGVCGAVRVGGGRLCHATLGDSPTGKCQAGADRLTARDRTTTVRQRPSRPIASINLSMPLPNFPTRRSDDQDHAVPKPRFTELIDCSIAIQSKLDQVAALTTRPIGVTLLIGTLDRMATEGVALAAERA